MTQVMEIQHSPPSRTTWPMVKLGDASSSIDYGVTASANLDGKGNKFLRITDIQENGVDWRTVPWCVCSDKELNNARLKSGDIVFARTGATTGKSYLINECPQDAVFASYLIRVRLKEHVDSKFISFFFQSPNYWQQVKNSARGAAQPGINSTVLKSLLLPLPPLPEQQRIVTRLDKAQQLIDQRKEQLKLMDALVQSLFYEMFGDPVKNEKGWEVKPLSRLVKEDRSITYGILKPEEYISDGIPMLRIQDIKGNVVSKANLHLVSNELSTQYKRTILNGNELVISLVGTLGLTAIIPPTFKGSNVHRNLGVIDLNENVILRDFFFYFSLTNSFKQLIAALTKGGNQPLLNIGSLNELGVFVPPLPLQQTFADRVQQIDALKQSMTASLRELEHNFNALMQEAFEG